MVRALWLRNLEGPLCIDTGHGFSWRFPAQGLPVLCKLPVFISPGFCFWGFLSITQKHLGALWQPVVPVFKQLSAKGQGQTFPNHQAA